MQTSSSHLRAAALLALTVIATFNSIGWAASPAGPPSGTREPTRVARAHAVPADTGRPSYAAADVRFMQGMIAHHAQALRMTALVQARTNRADMRLLAQRIDVSQRDEIAMMRRWLQDRHQTAPDPDAEHAHEGMNMGAHEALMPGMLTQAELAQLAKATGTGFDRLFLQFMIHHHEGALTMVSALFATPGAGQEGEVFRFASDVDTDQRAEIARMRAMLSTLKRIPK